MQSLLLLLQLLSLASIVARADVSITLTNPSNKSLSYESYNTVEFFHTKYTNIPSDGITGFLHQPDPSDGCSYIPPIPSLASGVFSNETHTWIAIIDGYPKCVEKMLLNVQNAGYKLILAPTRSDQDNITLSRETRNMGFPVVLISIEYSSYLIQNALSNFTNPRIIADVNASADLFVVIIVLLFAFVMFPTCFVCCSLCCYCRARRARQNRDSTHVQQRQRNFNQDEDNIARGELLDSILRQLQLLQLDLDVQHPLGKEQTRKLPTRKYQRKSSIEACAICVEDFKEGDYQKVLPCHHSFHVKCVDEWLMNHSDLCPLCKNQVPRNKEETYRSGRRSGRTSARNLLQSFTDEATESDVPLVRADGIRGQEVMVERYGSV